MYLALFMMQKETIKRVYTSPMCTCTPQTHIEEYKGWGTTVASDVTGHRGPKIQ